MNVAKLALLLAGSLVVVSSSALARDGAHLVCTGYMESKPGPDNYGFAVQFDEGRAEDGESRIEVLSTVWGGNLYQGRRLNKNDGFGENGKIVMTAPASKKKVFFKGQYNLVEDKKTGRYQLHLKGRMNLTPAGLAEVESISTDLNCIDISN